MSRILIISDIHANCKALEAIKKSVKLLGLNPTAWWILGDTLGTGPLPLDTWRTVEALRPQVLLAGNHDWYVAPYDLTQLDGDGLLSGPVYIILDGKKTHVSGPHEAAWEVAMRHRRSVTQDILTKLGKLPCRANPLENVFVAHATYCGDDMISNPSIWLESILRSESEAEKLYQSPEAIWKTLSYDLPILHISGHTHIQGLWQRDRRANDDQPPSNLWYLHGEGGQPRLKHAYELVPGQFYHINPGGVGFPRGRAHCPNYCLLDTDEWTVTFFVIEKSTTYNSEIVREKMGESRYPASVYDEVQLKPCSKG